MAFMSKSDHTLFNIIWQWSRIIDRAGRIKKDPERRQNVVRFGVYAIIYSVLAILCVTAFLLFKLLPIGILLNVVVAVIAVTIGGLGTLICIVTALIHWFCQLSMNKKPFTWVSLAIMLGCFLATALIPALIHL